MRARGLVAVIAMAGPGGCSYVASPESLLDPDVISIAIVLVAGESQAHLLAGSPHLGRLDTPPRVTASLIGPGWRADFTHETETRDGCGGGPTDWPIPMVCIKAVLPEPIREKVAYRLVGKGPKGSFTGETVVPAAPLILEPRDTVWLPGSTRVVRIPVRYRAPPEVGTMRPEVFQTISDTAGTESEWIRVWPRTLNPEGQDTVVWGYSPKIRWASLHVLGIGRHYTFFWRLRKNRVPWPRAGISGEGVYGYFDGSARSGPISILLEDGG